jgi:P-type Cu+ transporter
MTKKIKLTIEGMHCASCSSNIERATKKIKGVISANISILTRKGIFEIEDSVNPEQIKKEIERIGYKVVNIE